MVFIPSRLTYSSATCLSKRSVRWSRCSWNLAQVRVCAHSAASQWQVPYDKNGWWGFYNHDIFFQQIKRSVHIVEHGITNVVLPKHHKKRVISSHLKIPFFPLGRPLHLNLMFKVDQPQQPAQLGYGIVPWNKIYMAFSTLNHRSWDIIIDHTLNFIPINI